MRACGELLAAVAVLGLAAPVVALTGPAADGPRLHYTVTLRRPDDPRVEVVALLEGIAPVTPTVRWMLPQQFAFVRLPEPLLAGPVRASAADTALDCHRDSPWEWTVATGGRAALRLEYVVPLTHRALEAVQERDAYEYPYVARDHGMLVSATLFLYPRELTLAQTRVRFVLPEGWPVIAPWRSTGEGELAPETPEAVLNDLVAIGAWLVHPVRIGGFEVTIALAPGQEELAQVVVEPLRRIVEHELRLFGRPMEGRYLFLFGRPEGRGLAGSPKTRSMTLSVDPRLAPVAGKYVPHLVAHEFFNTWAAGLELPGELRWVNEGFTDYYACLIPARLGLTTWAEFAAALAEKMQSCAGNPQAGQLALTAAGGDIFFRDKDAYELVYGGGTVLAAWLDRAVRRADGGQTLDDLLRAFYNDPRWAAGRPAPTLDDFLAVVRTFVPADMADKLRQFVERPFAFDPVVEFAALGVAIRRELAPPVLDLRANLDGLRVVDLDRNALAYRIGVRAGDRLVAVNGQPVRSAADVRAAWRQPADQRMRITLERDGQTVKVDEPIVETYTLIVPSEPWRGS